jgi:parvulin-like peptidyl-prolyl isomerase
MAILSKIRERSLFLILIIGLALFSFVLSGVFKNSGGGSNNSVGEINGENISREEFVQLVDQQRTRVGTSSSQMQNVNNAWENLLREKIYKSQLEKSGVVVGEKDNWDEITKQPFVLNNPQFKNENGLFDEDKFKEFIATLEDAANDNESGKVNWLSWLNYEKTIKTNLEIKTYNNLISAGLNVTQKDGEHYYFDNNTTFDLEYVYVPYNFIADSLVNISDDDIKNYVKDHPKDYTFEASRDVSFVKFEVKPTVTDEENIRKNLLDLINDREEYSTAAKNNVKIKGFANTDDIVEFFRENNSDIPLNNNFYFKAKLNKSNADSIYNLQVNEIYGPYKDGDYIKLTKLIDTKQLPDSAKARHILIPFKGAIRANSSITQTEVEAKKTADSILTLLRRDRSKFSDLAKKLSADTGSGAKGGELGWFPYDRMVPEFRDFTFENKVGTMKVVKSAFGFHIIEIEGQKNVQKVVKLASFSRKIVASEETENDVFLKAETFASELSQGKEILDLVKENKLMLQPVVGLKALTEKVSSLGNQRQIVNWAFDKSTNVNEIKRFDLANGYAIVKLDAKHKKGLGVGKFKFVIRNILLKEKKAKLITEKMQQGDLQEIAQTFNRSVNSSKAVSLGSPVLPGVGRSADLVQALIYLNENNLYKGIEAQKGVFAVKIIKKNAPKPLFNYNSLSTIIKKRNSLKIPDAFEALKKIAKIEDNRSSIY